MRTLFITFVLLLACGVAKADEITIDSTGWTQEQKNMTQAIVVSLLNSNSVTYDSIQVDLPTITIKNPSNDISALTTQVIVNKYNQWLIEAETANAAEAARVAELEAEINNSELKEVSLDQIDSKIDSITTLAELKTFLKKLARYIKARGL